MPISHLTVGEPKNVGPNSFPPTKVIKVCCLIFGYGAACIRSWSRSTPEVVPGQGHLLPGVFPLPSHLFPVIAVTRLFYPYGSNRQKCIPYSA